MNNVPNEYKPISPWGYIGYQILFSIPVVGLILILVFSFGGASNKNLKNFARAYIIVYIIVIIIFAISIAMGFSVSDNLKI